MTIKNYDDDSLIMLIIDLCALGNNYNNKVDMGRPAVRYVTTGRIYIGICRPEIITTHQAERNVSQLLQQVGLSLREYGNTTLPPPLWRIMLTINLT